MELLCSSPIGRGCARLGACSIRGPASPSAHGLATASSSEWADLYVRENESCQLCPEEFTYRLETRINAGFHVFDLEKYRQKYRHL